MYVNEIKQADEMRIGALFYVDKGGGSRKWIKAE